MLLVAGSGCCMAEIKFVQHFPARENESVGDTG